MFVYVRLCGFGVYTSFCMLVCECVCVVRACRYTNIHASELVREIYLPRSYTGSGDTYAAVCSSHNTCFLWTISPYDLPSAAPALRRNSWTTTDLYVILHSIFLLALIHVWQPLPPRAPRSPFASHLLSLTELFTHHMASDPDLQKRVGYLQL